MMLNMNLVLSSLITKGLYLNFFHEHHRPEGFNLIRLLYSVHVNFLHMAAEILIGLKLIYSKHPSTSSII